jgi:hypothetical protein
MSGKVSDTGSPEPLVFFYIEFRSFVLNNKIVKNHPCHVCFKLADWFQRRRLLNNFPIGPMLKLSADGGHFEPRSGSLNTILEVDHLRTIDDMFAILAENCLKVFSSETSQPI